MTPEPPDHEFLIIGAGFGGVGLGKELRKAGIDDFVIVDRAAEIGGVWQANVYPGVAVDIPSLAYQFRSEVKPDWSHVFARGAEVREYIQDIADRYDVSAHVRLRTEVTAERWDEDEHLWRVTLDGSEVTARYVVSAVGVFPEPKPAQLPGLADFTGKVMHSTGWDHDYDLTGKRVAVIGTGASALQIVPEIAPIVERLDVFQRTPIWVLPKPDKEIPRWMHRLFARSPLAARLVNRVACGFTEIFTIGLPILYGRFPWMTKRVERAARSYHDQAVRDPDLRRRLTPDYRFACKRPSFSNHYLQSFERDNVSLVTDPIDAITATGMRTAGGESREVDVIVLATGFFNAFDPEIYRRRPVTGRDGFDLAAHFAEHRIKAYETITMPGLPNHFMLYGPYGGTGGAYQEMIENGCCHILRATGEARRRGATAIEVTAPATDRFHGMVERRMANALWFVADCSTANSYYYDHHGDVPAIRPTTGWQARRASRTFPLEDYHYSVLPSRRRQPVGAGGRSGSA